MPVGSRGDIDPSLAALPNSARMQHVALKKGEYSRNALLQHQLEQGLAGASPALQ